MGRPDVNALGDDDYDVADFDDFVGEGAFGTERLPRSEVDEDDLDSDLYEDFRGAPFGTPPAS